MELAFNFIWALVTIASLCLWFRFGCRKAAERRLSLIALIMLIAILFPVISVSDDLWSIQNPAETDTCLRRNTLDSGLHSQPFLISTLPQPAALGLTLEFQRLGVPRFAVAPAIDQPALVPIDNRPPPDRLTISNLPS